MSLFTSPKAPEKVTYAATSAICRSKRRFSTRKSNVGNDFCRCPRILLDNKFSDLHLLYFPRSKVGEEKEAAQKEEDRDQDRLATGKFSPTPFKEKNKTQKATGQDAQHP